MIDELELGAGVHLRHDYRGTEGIDDLEVRHAWTAPRTWVTSELVTSTIMNTHVRDNLLWLSPADQAGTSFPGSPQEGQLYHYLYRPEGIVWTCRYSLDQSVQTGTLNGTTTVTGLTDTSLLHVGMTVTGTNIPASTYIATIVSATSITLSQAASGSSTNALTFQARYPWHVISGAPLWHERATGNFSQTTYQTQKTYASLPAGDWYCNISHVVEGAPPEVWYASIGFGGAAAADADAAKAAGGAGNAHVRSYVKYAVATGAMIFAIRKTDGTNEGVGGASWYVRPVRLG